MCTGHGSAAARRAVCCPPTAAPARPQCLSMAPAPTSRRAVWVGLKTARATTHSSRDRLGATGSQGSSGPHRASRCAASPSGTVLWRRSVWAPGGWSTPKPRMIEHGPGRHRSSARPAPPPSPLWPRGDYARRLRGFEPIESGLHERRPGTGWSPVASWPWSATPTTRSTTCWIACHRWTAS